MGLVRGPCVTGQTRRECLRQVGGVGVPEGPYDHGHGVDPIAEVILALSFPGTGLDDVIAVYRLAQLLFHGPFDVILQPVYGSPHALDRLAERQRRRGIERGRILEIEPADDRRTQLLLESRHRIQAQHLAVLAADEYLRQVLGPVSNKHI